MKKIALSVFSLFLITSLLAQDSLKAPMRDTLSIVPVKKKKDPINLAGRSNDHFLVQYGYAGWNGKPDSIQTGGLAHSFNVYFMLDFPFKTSPKLSVAIGAGVSSDVIKFKKTFVGIKENTSTLQFLDQADTNHFKKSKLVTTYLEAPIELRFTSDPLNSGKSWKFALGVKVGTMINAHTRYKDLQSASGGTINDYTTKESSKRFFNTTRLQGTARIGYGHFTIFGGYQFTTLFKEGVAAEIRPFSVGLTLSGL